MKNYYKILGLTHNASNDEIKKAYRNLSVKYHPDSNLGSKSTEEIMKEINEAYHILKDGNRRKEYDFYFTKYYTPEDIILYKDKDNNTKHKIKVKHNSTKQTKSVLFYIVASVFIIGLIMSLLIIYSNKNHISTEVNQTNLNNTPQPAVNEDEMITYEIWDRCDCIECPTINETRTKGTFRIKSGNKFGLADADSNIIINPEYDLIYCGEENDGYIEVTQNGKIGLMDIMGNTILPIKYEFIKDVKNGFVTVKKDNLWGVIDFNEKEIIPIIYEACSGLNEDLVFIKKGGKFSLVNKNLQNITGFIFDSGNTFKDGLGAVQKNRKWGYIDRNGKVILPITYDDIGLSNPTILNNEYKFFVKKNKNWFWVTIENKRTSSPYNFR
jgi:hypothetical protein